MNKSTFTFFVFILFLHLIAGISADEKYLLFRQPSSTTQVGEVVKVPPFGVMVADERGKFTAPRPLVPSDIAGIFGYGVPVSSFSSLQAALASTYPQIFLAADITVTANLTIPKGKTVFFNGYKITEGSAQVTVLFYGEVLAGRVQIFKNWEAGDINGFTNQDIFPEWWGLVGSTVDDGQHDLAINAALKANLDNVRGVRVSLGATDYVVSKPIDIRGTNSTLIGAGSGLTKIYASRNWAPVTWDSSAFWDYYATKGAAAISSVQTANAGAHIAVNTAAGGAVEFIPGRTAKITGSSVTAYNGTWTVSSVTDHDTVVLVKPFVANATGTVTPVTLDSVMEVTTNNCSSLVWVGSPLPDGNNSFFSSIKGVSFVGGYAVEKYPSKRISGISWTGYVEEQSLFEDITISGFSGFGFGGSYGGVETTNGLTLRNFLITGATRRGACPIFVGGHAGVHAIRDGTLDCRIGLSQSYAADPDPTYVWDWPQFGILTSGAHTVVDNVHIEGCGNGVHVYAWDGAGSVSISNVDGIHMMDFKQVYYNDLANRWAGPAPALATQEATEDNGASHPFYFHYGCLVSIGRMTGAYHAGDNYNSNVSVNNARSLGGCNYLLRDWVYGVEHSSYGSRYPNTDTGALTSYERGTPFGLPTGVYPDMVAGAYYDRNSPASDKTYFRLIY